MAYTEYATAYANAYAARSPPHSLERKLIAADGGESTAERMVLVATDR